MTLSLSAIPGFTDLPDSALVTDKPAYSIHVGDISQNAAFGMVRTEVFIATYVDGDTVALPQSPIDGYNYSREELLYLWTVKSSVNQRTGWVSGIGGSLWYCGWLVDQGIAGPIKESLLHAGGTGYAVGNTFTVNGSLATPLAAGIVDAISGGGGTGPVTRYHLTDNGTSYKTGTGQGTTHTSGSGTGLTIDITSVASNSGKVSVVEAYRENNKRGSPTQDGILLVFTIAQRQKTKLIVASAPTYSAINVADIATDKPWKQSLVQGLNDNAKFGALNAEVFYCGEFINGDTVPMTQCVSPADGYSYGYSETKFMYSWRWTAENNVFRDPPLSAGQLSPFTASVSSVGVVAITVKMTPHGNTPVSHTDYGRIAVFAFCQRSGTPGSAPLADTFTEIDRNLFLPGGSLRASTVLQIKKNIDEAILSPEWFGPTTYKNGDTVALPTSPVDGYVYSRAELQYIYDWSDTNCSTSSHNRLAVFSSNIDQTSGLVTLHTWRQIPGSVWADDDDADSRISVLVMAQRASSGVPLINHPKTKPTPPTDAGTGSGNPPYDLAFALQGKPAAATEYPWFTFPRIVGYYPDFLNSYGSVGTAPTLTQNFIIKLNGQEIGTATVATNGAVSFASTNGHSPLTAQAGSGLFGGGTPGLRLTIVSPTVQDATLSDVSFTLVGVLDTGGPDTGYGYGGS